MYNRPTTLPRSQPLSFEPFAGVDPAKTTLTIVVTKTTSEIYFSGNFV